jgi:Sulfotransferase family
MADASAMPDRFVFIVTYGRSGSTLLQKLLNSLPGYCIRGENGNGLFRLFQAWQDITDRPGVRFMRRTKRVTTASDAWFGVEAVDPDVLARALVKTFVDEVLRLPAGTRVGGFKEVRWYKAANQFPAFMNFVHANFPSVQVVINTRNLDSVVKSGWWAKRPPELVKKNLGQAEELYAAYRAQYPDATIALHYDDYKDNPDAFAPLYAFLEETFDREKVKTILSERLTH